MAVRIEFLLPFAVSLFVVLASKSQAVCPDDQEKDWSYSGANGPLQWGEIGFPHCDGQKQSPVDIPKNVTKSFGGLLGYFAYTIPVNGEVENNGHTVEIIPTDRISRGIKVGISVYPLHQFHFHFGDGNRELKGSEHKLSGRTFAMEMHLVHRNHLNQHAVVGLFFDEVDTDNPNLESLLAAVNSVEYEGDKKEIEEPINLYSLLPKCQNTYYQYKGSLTTPPCSETVTWFVLREPIPISTRQLQAFRKQHSVPRSSEDADQCYLANNFRPVQPLNGRSITLFNDGCSV